MKMEKYRVEFQRTTYITLEVEANTQINAEAFAWQELERTTQHMGDADWRVESVLRIYGDDE
jgi:hypothetical protein